MRYVGTLKARNGMSYSVTIQTPRPQSSDEPDIELTFVGEEPIIIEQQSDGLFTPIKGHSCTIRILTPDYYFDMYNSNPKDVSVLIENDDTGQTEFEGYVTPNIYSQEWRYMNEIEIEAIDKLSVLQYYEYETVTENEYNIVPLYNVLKKLLYDTCGFDQLYFSRDIIDNIGQGDSCLMNIGVNERNFFEDDGKYVQVDGRGVYQANAWKMNEVLEEICKFLNVSCFVFNNSVYMINYYCTANDDDELEDDDARRFRIYNFTTDRMSGNLDCNYEYTINASSYRSEGGQVSLDPRYSKISVSCNEYEIEDNTLLPDMFKKDLVIPNAYGVGDEWIPISGYHKDTFKVEYKKSTYKADYYLIPYKHLSWQTYNYGAPNDKEFFLPYLGVSQVYELKPSYADLLDKCTSRMESEWIAPKGYRMTFMSSDDGGPEIDGKIWDSDVYLGRYQQLGATILRHWENDNYTKIPASAEWNEYVVFGCGLPGAIINEDAEYGYGVQTVAWKIALLNDWHKNNNAILMEATGEPSLTYGKDDEDTYLVINADVMYNLFLNYPCDELGNQTGNEYIKPYTALKKPDEPVGQFYEYPTLQMQVQIGDHYYNTTGHFEIVGEYRYWHEDTAVWTTDPTSKCYLPASNNNELVYNDWMSVANTVDFHWNIDATGYAIRIPAGTKLTGKLQVRFFCPRLYPYGISRKKSDRYKHITVPRWVTMKDFSIKYCTSQGNWFDIDSEDNETDTKHSNIEEEMYTEELDEIELKINTQVPDKRPSYSSVIDMESGEYKENTISHSLGDLPQIQERNIIQQQYAHYHEPRINLSMSIPYYKDEDERLSPFHVYRYPLLKNGASFMMDTTLIDLKNNSQEVNLIEF